MCLCNAKFDLFRSNIEHRLSFYTYLMISFSMKYSMLTVFAFMCLQFSCQNSTLTFMANYMREYRVNWCYLFIDCWKNHELIDLSKTLSSFGIRSTIVESSTKAHEVLRDKNITQYGFFLDLHCSNFRNILDTKRVNLRSTRPWLVLANTSNTSSSFWEEFFEDVPLRLDSNFKIAVPQKTGKFKLLDIHNPGFGLEAKPLVSDIGSWNGTSLYVDRNVSFYMQRKDMSSVRLRNSVVVLKADHPGTFEEYMLNVRLKQYDTQSKFHYPQFLILQMIHNFSFNITFEDKWYGDTVSGIDGGIARLLHEDLTDISGTGGAQRFSRVDFLDYLMPSYHFRPLYIFRNPGLTNYISGEFLKPFTSGTWYAFGASVTVISIMLKRVYDIENKIFRTKVRYSWAAIFLMTVSPILNQGSDLSPSRFTSRFVYFVLLTMSIVVYNYYTSSILSSLLSTPKSALETLGELAHSNLDVGIENLPYTLTWFIITNHSSSPISLDSQYIYKNKVVCPKTGKLNIMPPEEGIAMVEKGGFAYHTQADTGYSIIEKTFTNQDAICDLDGIPMLPQTAGGLMVQKKSQYSELFTITLRKAKQAGLIKRYSLIWEAEKPECLSSVRVVPVEVSQTFMAYFCLIVGMIVSLVILMVERKWETFLCRSHSGFQN